MNKRLLEFINYKTGGNHKEFADLLGWSPQYLHKMLKGDSMGIQPVISLLEKFPELNARWLILGEGVMLTSLRERIMLLVELERYIPVMSREEIDSLVSGKEDFGKSTIERWQTLLDKREGEISQRFAAAYAKQNAGVPPKNS